MTHCPSCGAEVAVENVFPGGSVQCTCGASVVALAPTAPATTAASASLTEPVAAVRAPVCPRCSASLVVTDVDGVVVAACPKNHGLFATHHALEGLAHDANGPIAEEQPLVACPRCSEPMTARLFTRGSTIVVDVCDAHGTWLDAGELQAATAEPSANAPSANPTTANDALNRRAAAVLDVSLALEQARDEETAREAIDVADDLIDTFNVFVLGRTRTSYGKRYRSR